MHQNRFLDFLFNSNALLQPLLSFSSSVFFGFHVFYIENAMAEKQGFFAAVKNVGLTKELIISTLFLILLFLYHYFIMIRPLERFEKIKNT